MRIFAHITALFLFSHLVLGPAVIPNVYALGASGSAGAGATATQDSSACDSIADGELKQQCVGCMGKKNNTSTWTAIGCITTDPNDPNGLLSKIISLAMGVSGGIAFLLILFGGLQIMTSAGNPEQLNAGRELVTSAITGLLLIIFSIFILQFIGVNIIGIPGFK